MHHTTLLDLVFYIKALLILILCLFSIPIDGVTVNFNHENLKKMVKILQIFIVEIIVRYFKSKIP